MYKGVSKCTSTHNLVHTRTSHSGVGVRGAHLWTSQRWAAASQRRAAISGGTTSLTKRGMFSAWVSYNGRVQPPYWKVYGDAAGTSTSSIVGPTADRVRGSDEMRSGITHSIGEFVGGEVASTMLLRGVAVWLGEPELGAFRSPSIAASVNLVVASRKLWEDAPEERRRVAGGGFVSWNRALPSAHNGVPMRPRSHRGGAGGGWGVMARAGLAISSRDDLVHSCVGTGMSLSPKWPNSNTIAATN